MYEKPEVEIFLVKPVKPFIDIEIINSFFRIFDDSVKEEDLIWHKDKFSRALEIKKSRGWKLQIDNELPVNLEENQIYLVPQLVHHRLIKGEGQLIMRINELRNKWKN